MLETINGIDLVLALVAAAGWSLAAVRKHDYQHAHERGVRAGLKQAGEWQKLRESQNEVQSGMLRVVPPRRTTRDVEVYDHERQGL